MPLNKSDDPKADKAKGDILDAGAGVPEGYIEAAEALPERDPVQKAHKEQYLADDAQAEAKAKVKSVDESPDAADTPSGFALKKTAGISDDVERGNEYARVKSSVRW